MLLLAAVVWYPLLASNASAATATWNGSGDTIWSNGLNWSSSPNAPASGDTAVFNGAGNGNVAVTLSSGTTIKSITFDTANAAAYTMGTTGGSILALGALGTIQTNSTVVNAQTINAPLSLAGNYSFLSGASSSSATLNFGGSITNTASSTLTLGGANTGANTISGVIGNTIAITQSAGNWVLTGVNTYSGATTVNAGATLTIGGAGQLGGGNYAGVVTTNGTFNYNSSAAQTFSAGLIGSGAFNVGGSGTLTLTGNNGSYSGATTIKQGATLVLNNASSAGTGLVTDNGTLVLTINNSARFISGLVGSGTVTTNALSGTVTLYFGGLSQFDGVLKNGANANLGLSVKSGTLTLTGASTFTGNVALSGGMLVVSQLSDTGASSIGNSAIGTFAVGSGFGYNGSTAASTSRAFSGIGNSAGGTLTFDASGATPSATLTLNQASWQSVGNAGTTTNFILQGSNTGANAITGAIKNQATAGAITAVTKNGVGSWVLSGSNSYVGNTAINSGMLQFANKNALYSGSSANWTAAKITAASGATLAVNVGGTGEFSASDVNTLLTNIFTNASTGAGLQSGAKLGLDTTNATGGTFTQGNAITDSAVGSIGLTKLGTNTLVLDKTNTYTGATTVSGGKLIVSGALAAASTTTIGSGATLAGGANHTSTVGAIVANAGATVLPGDVGAAGTLNTGDITLTDSTVHLGIELGTVTSSDQIVTSLDAPVTISLGGATLDLLLLAGYIHEDGERFLIINNQNDGSTLNGSFASGASIIEVGTEKFSVLYHANYDSAGNWVSDTGGNDVALLAVPEPSTWAMLIGGVGMLAFGQRFRRRMR